MNDIRKSSDYLLKKKKSFVDNNDVIQPNEKILQNEKQIQIVKFDTKMLNDFEFALFYKDALHLIGNEEDVEEEIMNLHKTILDFSMEHVSVLHKIPVRIGMIFG